MTLATPTLLEDLFICPECKNVRRAWGQKPPLCDRAAIAHADRERIQPAPRSTNRPKITSAMRPVVMVPLFGGGS